VITQRPSSATGQPMTALRPNAPCSPPRPARLLRRSTSTPSWKNASAAGPRPLMQLSRQSKVSSGRVSCALPALLNLSPRRFARLPPLLLPCSAHPPPRIARSPLRPPAPLLLMPSCGANGAASPMGMSPTETSRCVFFSTTTALSAIAPPPRLCPPTQGTQWRKSCRLTNIPLHP